MKIIFKKDCSHNAWGEHECNEGKCVRLFCADGGPNPPNVAEPEGILVHNPSTGILSYSYGGVVRAICDDGFGEIEAATACFQLYGSRDVAGMTTGN